MQRNYYIFGRLLSLMCTAPYPFLAARVLCSGLFACFAGFLISCGRQAPDLALVAYNDQENQVFNVIDTHHAPDTIKLERGHAHIKETLFTRKGPFFFGVDEGEKCLVRFEEKNGEIVENGRLQLPPDKWHRLATWYNWVDDHTLFLGSSVGGKKFTYSLVDVDKMELKNCEPLDIPLPPGDMYYGGVLGRLVGNRLYVAYMLYRYEKGQEPAGDTIYLATIDYPSMKTIGFSKDTRSTFPGGYMINWEVSFEENEDVFFIAQPGGRLRARNGKLPRIYRIAKGASELDPDYDFPLTSLPDEEVYGLFYVGQGKALVKSVRKSELKEFSDYWDKDIASYYLIDVRKKTKKRVDLPKGHLGLTANITRQGDRVLIAIPSKTTSSLWELDPETGRTVKIANIDGSVRQLFSMGAGNQTETQASFLQ